jgi:hypothetical protein
MLTIGHYWTLLQYALDRQLLIKSLLVTTPDFLNVRHLPPQIKQQYSQTFDPILDQLTGHTVQLDYNVSDPNNFAVVIKQQALMCKNILASDTLEHSHTAYQQLAAHCQKWDGVYEHNARALYPELTEIWDQHGH